MYVCVLHTYYITYMMLCKVCKVSKIALEIPDTNILKQILNLCKK